RVPTTVFLSSFPGLTPGGNDLTPESIEPLAACPSLVNLTSLDLEYGVFWPEAARALARSAHLGNLRSLNLRATGVGDEGLAELVAGPGLAGLTDLNLSDCYSLTAEGLATLLASRLRLWRLTCRNFTLGDPPGEILAASPMLASLRDLDFTGSDWTDRAVQALAAAPGLALSRLDLTINHIGDAGAVALASCLGLAGLRSLRLG